MKKKNIKNKGIGIIEIIVAFLFFIEGVWLYTKVLGTNLLFTDSATGKIAAYYWVFLLIGLLFGILAIITIRKKDLIENAKEEVAILEEVKSIENKILEETKEVENESSLEEIKEIENKPLEEKILNDITIKEDELKQKEISERVSSVEETILCEENAKAMERKMEQ